MIVLKKENWNLEKIIDLKNEKDGKIVINNTSSKKIEFKYKSKIKIREKGIEQIRIDFEGEFSNAGGYMIINDDIKIPFNSSTLMEVKIPVDLEIKIIVFAESMISFGDIIINTQIEKSSLLENVSNEQDILVVTPSYPSLENLYHCAFVHSRVKEYINSGLKVQVASISGENWFQTIYNHEGVPVIKGNYGDLKQLLSRHQYKVILTHFVDENLYPIYDGYISNEKLIFICHGPETVFRYLVNVTRPYFTKKLPYPTQNEAMDEKERWIKRFNKKDNVEWVFVSEWLKDFSEQELGIQFKNSRVEDI